MDPLLESLRAAGRLESEGSFTVDTAAAMEKLRQFALPDPDAWLVHLVEAAVLDGSVKIEVRRHTWGTTVESDGRPYGRDDLRELLTGLLSGRWTTDHPIHPLALGVNAALRAATSVNVSTASRGNLLVACYTSTGVEVMDAPAAVASSNRVAVAFRRRRPPWAFLTSQPELGLLRRHLRHCPADLRLHGAVVTGPVELPPCLVLTRVKAEKGPPLPELRESAHVLTRTVEGPRNALVTLGWGGAGAPLRVIQGGRVFAPEVPLFPTATALVAASDLRTDLTRGALLQDERLEALRERLDEEVQSMRGYLAERFDALPSRHKPVAAPHLFLLQQGLTRAGRFVEAAEIAERLGRFRIAARGGLAACSAQYRLGILLFQAGQFPEGRRTCLRAMEAGAEAFHVRVTPSDTTAGGPLPEFEMHGAPEAVLAAHTWMLALEEDTLGPTHSIPNAHRAWNRTFREQHGLPAPTAPKPQDLGSEPDPQTLRPPRFATW